MPDLDVSTNIDFLLLEAFDEEKACEHPLHSNPGQKEFHEGAAKWYAQVMCPDCGAFSDVCAVCDKWLKSAESNNVLCGGCWKLDRCIFLVKEKIK